MAGVAQLVEHRFVVPSVAGSSPVARPMKFKNGPFGPFFIENPQNYAIYKGKIMEYEGYYYARDF